MAEDVVSELKPEMKMGSYVLKFECDDQVDEVYKKIAKEELRESDYVKERALIELKELISQDEDIYIASEGIDMYLLAFLRSSKFYPQSAFRRLKILFKFKLKHPKYFANLLPKLDKNVFAQNILTVLPQRDQNGRRILVVQPGEKWKPSECSLVEITRGALLIIEAAMLEPVTQITGAILIMDLEGLNLQHVWNITPNYAKMLLDFLQECLPLRVKAIHIINQPYIFNMAFAIFKPFMREKLRNRIFLHGTDENSLLSHIDSKSLPVSFGGMMDVSLDDGLNLWKLLNLYNEQYERTSQFGYKINHKH